MTPLNTMAITFVRVAPRAMQDSLNERKDSGNRSDTERQREIAVAVKAGDKRNWRAA